MKKYILIQNDGAIETNSFELIGASTKRDEKGKIGFFGSGLKYSIAYMMRKGIDFKVFSGLTELKFTTTEESLKEKPFARICINGKPTSYTTTMGPTWTQDWVVLREIYCNAIDEGSCQLVRGIENTDPSEGKTRIFIELTTELQYVINNWDSYFADERSALFTTEEIYTSSLGNMDGNSDQTVTVFQKTKGTLYRRGIRVHTNGRYLYDYGMTHVNINEDRTAANAFFMRYVTSNIMALFSNESYVKNVLRTVQSEKPCEEYESLNAYEISSDVSDAWITFSQQNMLVAKDVSGRYAEEIQKTKKEVFLIPNLFARELKKRKPAIIIMGMQNLIGNFSINLVERTSKMEFLLKEVLQSLKQMSYEICFEIQVVEFEDESTMGMADIPNKTILIASKTFDMGRRELAMTLIEENEHIISGKEDQTRAFQTHIFSQWLKSMENSNGLFL